MTLEQKLKESNNELEKREQLAAEVEQRVADRIAKAQRMQQILSHHKHFCHRAKM